MYFLLSRIIIFNLIAQKMCFITFLPFYRAVFNNDLVVKQKSGQLIKCIGMGYFYKVMKISVW
ncbi:MAG TPA: hypothetical protein DEB62_11375 [Vibrio sp.]|uniref:Uncharacterized protein n=1 Tax=Vibrio casei TaxID=673372 RepID=A0A368LIX6_9VIBR|nr:hypothetical protein CIK83_12825 [Vibrio casei]HBV76973.1 hypothetical protein [Vibrio sp.]